MTFKTTKAKGSVSISPYAKEGGNVVCYEVL